MRIGPWWIQPYTVRVMLGGVLAIGWLVWRAPAYAMPRRDVTAWLWSLGLITVFGGRVGYVLENWGYFTQNPHQIWQLDAVGGLCGEAALFGAIVCTWGWATLSHVSPVIILTWLTPAILLTIAGAWWGCLAIGCAWGREVPFTVAESNNLVAQLPDIYHSIRFRYAVQVFGIAWAIVMWIFSVGLKRYGDIILGIYLLGAALLTLLRGDPVPEIQAIRIDTLVYILLAFWLFWTGITQRKKPSFSPT